MARRTRSLRLRALLFSGKRTFMKDDPYSFPGEEKEGNLGSVARVLAGGAVSARTVCTRPQLELVVQSPKQVLIGQQAVLEITVRNKGTGAAEGVVLHEDVPANFEHAAGHQLESEIGRIEPGQSRTLTLSLKATRPGRGENRLQVRTGDQVHAEHRASIEVVAPRLEIAVEGPRRRYLKRAAALAVQLVNQGTAPSQGIAVRAHLPQGLQFRSAALGGRYDRASHTITWQLASLPPGKSGRLAFEVLPTGIGQQVIRVEAQAPLGQRPQTEHQLQVDGVSELTFTVADTNDPIEVGSETTYAIRIQNEGVQPDTRIVLEAAFPPGIEPIAVEGDSKGTVRGSEVVFEPVASLPPGGTLRYRIRARGTQPGSHLIRVRVTSQQTGVPVTREEQTRVYADR